MVIFIDLYFRSLIDVVYALKDEVLELKKVNEKFLELRPMGSIFDDFVYFNFAGEQVDETVSGGGAEVSQRAGESCSKDSQAEERLYLGWWRPLNRSLDPPSSDARLQLM